MVFTQLMKKKLKAMEIMFCRNSYKLTLINRLLNEEITALMGGGKIATVIVGAVETKNQKWYRRACRIVEDLLPKRLLI